MLRMDQHCPCFLCEFFNGSLGYSILKMCSNFAIADCLVIIWHIALKTFLCKIPLSMWNFFTLMPKVAAIHSYAALASVDSMRVWPRCTWVYMYEVAWSTKTVAAQKRSDVKKPDICGMIPGVLDVNASKDVLSPAAFSDSLLMICF